MDLHDYVKVNKSLKIIWSFYGKAVLVQTVKHHVVWCFGPQNVMLFMN